MTKRCVAFLRAINVGGHTVRMEELRRHFEGLGLAGVETFIASGNVVFDHDRDPDRGIEARIEKHLAAALGYEVATFVRTLGQLEAVTAAHPHTEEDLLPRAHRLYVGFLHDEPDPAARAGLESMSTGTDDVRVVGRQLYWFSRVSMRDSKITGAALEKRIGAPTTLRNINTIHRLISKYGS